MTELTHKSNLVRDPAAGLRSLLSRITLVAINPASIPLRSIGGDSEIHHRLRGGFGMKECFRDGTQHTLSVWSLMLRFHINSDRADTTRQRDPSTRNLCQTMWRCVQSRCFTVTLIASRRKHTPRRHAPALVAWQSSRQFAGILHANSAAPPLMQPGEVGSRCSN
jgi:hypothetical protein